LALPPEITISQSINWREEDGKVVLLAPKYGRGFIDRILRKIFKEPTIIVKLDDIGSYIWKQCDNVTPLHEIISSFESAFSSESEKAEDRTEMFLTELHRQGWVNFVMPDQEMDSGHSGVNVNAAPKG